MNENEIIEKAVEVLQAKLPPRWEVIIQRTRGQADDGFLTFKDPSGSGRGVMLEVKRTLSPRDALVLLGGLARQLRRQDGNTPIVVAAPYISPRTRELLAEQEIGYVDLTGNVRIALEYPGVFIEGQGASRDPNTRARVNRGLRGAMVGRIVRVLIDAKPPYGVMDIAKAARISPGYTSRVLDVLESEALIDRDKRGPVRQLRWPDLVRRRAESVDLFDPVSTSSFISPVGARRALDKLSSIIVGAPWAVTGSFAAGRLAQVAAPSLLVVYSMAPEVVAEKLELRPADQGADVAVVRPKNPGVLAGAVPADDGINWVAASQAAIDCLSGTGRMPSEGDAVIEWMIMNEPEWRAESIAELIERWSSSRWD